MPDEPESLILRRYYDLRQHLGFGDPMDLDRAFLVTVPILEEAGRLAAEANAIENAAKHTLDIIKAEAGVRIRSIPISGKDPSEARIVAQLPLELDVQEARSALDVAHYEAEVCQSLCKAFEAQARLLGKASDMALKGFVSPDHQYEKRRAEVREARVAAEGTRVERPHN
jgi:hypothetical protein